MNKKVLIAAGAALGAALLIGTAAFATLNIAQAATRTGLALSGGPIQRILSATSLITSTEKGLVIVAVQSGGAADKAGVKRGDILLKIDDQETNTLADYKAALGSHKVSDQVKLAITHGDDQRTLTATLTDNNGQPDLGLLPFGGGGRGFGRQGIGFPGANISGIQTVVVAVVSGSPADKAGLQRGDVIVSVDSKKLDATNVLSDVISSYKPGDVVTLQVVSQGQSQRDLKVTLGVNPNKAGVAYLGVSYHEGGAEMPFTRGQMPFTQGVGSGAVIISVTAGSPADNAGLKQGDTITAVNGTAVSTPQALSSAIGALKPGAVVTLGVKHSDGTAADVKVTLGDNPNKAGTGYLGIATSTGRNRNFANGQQGMQGVPRLQNRGGRGNGAFGQGQTQQSVPLGDSL
ncbi:MAG TPA: PDZ domain-containing protein [Anaerolineae bacterium]